MERGIKGYVYRLGPLPRDLKRYYISIMYCNVSCICEGLNINKRKQEKAVSSFSMYFFFQSELNKFSALDFFSFLLSYLGYT